ncbi:MAG: DUF4012 domain-containing protein [Patescibacteria group bacterium]|jgi:hypothetical protein
MSSKRPQLRRCGLCHNTGHNKATCPEGKVLSAKPMPAAPLKFFVHHVNTPPPTSAHVVNLKSEKSEVWKTVDTSAPDISAPSLFQTYHNIKNSDETEPPINSKLFSDLHGAKKSIDPIVPKLNLKPIQEKKVKLKKPSRENFKFVTAKLVPSRLAMATVLIFTLALVIPGPLQGYFESLAQTKDTITENSTAGFMALQESATALKSANLTSAELATTAALSKFNNALETLTTKHTVLQSVVKVVPFLGGQIIGRERILLAGEQIALGNSYLLSGLKAIENNSGQPVTDKLNTLVEALRLANPNYKQAAENLSAVDENILPFEYRQQFVDFRKLFVGLVPDFERITGLNDTLQEIFGGKGLRRYILVFQNPAELRPTGGFMGSFAVLDIKDGKIINLDVPAGGTYDLQGQLSEYIIPPLPLTINNKRWEFQDANWFPDFPASAKKILWFYNHSRNVTADGVITINATVLEKILSIIGPVTDSSRNLTLTSSTALTAIQTVVETGSEKQINKPKQILADLAPQIISLIQNSTGKNLLPLLGSLEEALEEKEIQAYFTDTAVQKQILTSGWAGAIIDSGKNTDYLLVVNTNLQGQKSDARIKQTISHQAVVDDEGNVIDTVSISREHIGEPTEQFYGSVNVDFMRIYVPEGSTLISANGFSWPDEKNFRAPENWYKVDSNLSQIEQEVGIEQNSGTRITNEFGKTAFGNWVVTEPGKISRIDISYRLPFKVSPNSSTSDTVWKKIMSSFDEQTVHYQLVVQKQSGITSNFESQIIFPASWQPDWVSGDNVSLARNGLNIISSPLLRDSVWGILMKKPNQ